MATFVESTEDEYKREEEELRRKEERLSHLESEYERYMAAYPRRLLVTAEEKERERLEIKLLRENIDRLWSRWGGEMAAVREALRIARESRRRAARYRGVSAYIERRVAETYEARAEEHRRAIRRLRREIDELESSLKEKRSEYRKKLLPPPELAAIRREIESLEKELPLLREELARKAKVMRVETRLYVVINEKEKTYYYMYKGKRVSRTIKYPSGTFQAIYQHDALVKLFTDEIIKDRDPYLTAISQMLSDFITELYEEFHGVLISERDVVIGESNVILDQKDVGNPPVKVLLERTVKGEYKKYYEWSKLK